MTPMTDLDDLEADLLTRINAAPDTAALEAVRVEALGKQGSRFKPPEIPSAQP